MKFHSVGLGTVSRDNITVPPSNVIPLATCATVKFGSVKNWVLDKVSPKANPNTKDVTKNIMAAISIQRPVTVLLPNPT